jgi:hypothetical protein
MLKREATPARRLMESPFMASVRRVKFVVFVFIPLFALLIAAEATVRVKYFVAHGYEWAYLFAPFGAQHFAPANKEDVFRRPEAPPESTSASPAPAPASPASGSASPASTSASPASATGATAGSEQKQQMVFAWAKPCIDGMVYSTEQKKQMPRTFDDNCFRGDRVGRAKDPGEYRIVFLGGSTVEDFQSDAEMMTAQFKHAIPPTFEGKRITVVNAGRVTFASRRIATYYAQSVGQFSPDLVLYYEAWNEQPRDAKFARADDRLSEFRSAFHRRLYYRSMLYTYFVEKFAFLTTSNDYFWKIDIKVLRSGLDSVVAIVRSRGARFVFVTQAVKFPRMWKGIDTYDYRAVDALLDRLEADRSYVYDVTEISALNQRLTVAYTIEMCRQSHVPVVNILDDVEALGDAGRAEMFMDLGHLTVKGDKIVGELIAKRLAWSN